MKPRSIAHLIHTLRGERVILDSDLATLYEVPTKALNQAVKRNADRFPDDFMFRLTPEEWANLKSQIVTSSSTVSSEPSANRSHLVTSPHGGRRTLPFAFTEHGAIMAATVLNSPSAVAMSLFVVRSFMQMRGQLAANEAILKRLAEIDSKLLKHDHVLSQLWQQLQPLLAPPPAPPRHRIGFHP